MAPNALKCIMVIMALLGIPYPLYPHLGYPLKPLITY